MHWLGRERWISESPVSSLKQRPSLREAIQDDSQEFLSHLPWNGQQILVNGLLAELVVSSFSQRGSLLWLCHIWKNDIKAGDEHSLHVHHHSFREMKSLDQPWAGVPLPLSDEKVTLWELVAHLSSQEEDTKAFHYFYCLVRDSGKKQLCVLWRFNNIWKVSW